MLKEYSYIGDYKCPTIHLKNTGVFEFSGRSLPENSKNIYEPVIEWLNTYKENPCSETILHFKLEYFNTSSSKLLYEIFKILNAIRNKDFKTTINWYHEKEDEDFMDEAKFLISNLDLDLTFIEIEEFN